LITDALSITLLESCYAFNGIIEGDNEKTKGKNYEDINHVISRY
jgi:hypothetical protein